MITPDQQAELAARAYVPEHLTDYVTSISKAEPFLLGDFLIYYRQGSLIFVGYPLDGPVAEQRIEEAINRAREEFKPAFVSLTAPVLPASILQQSRSVSPIDHYYRLDVDQIEVSKKLRSLLRRSRRDLEILQARSLQREHKRLIDEFLRTKSLEREAAAIFKRLPEYARTDSASIYEARTPDGRLAAFDIADYSAGDYGFYLFNFCSTSNYIPGGADLLLSALIERACQEGKNYLNLGLGINPGVRSFKTKWGAQEYLPHRSCAIQEVGEEILDSLLDSLF